MKNKVCKLHHLKKIPCIQRNFQGCITPIPTQESMLFGCVQYVGKIGRNEKENLHIGGEMDYKKIKINESTYVKLFDDDRFEVHCSATGPLGAEVYSFKRGCLEWKQRRSYSFVSKRYKVTYE